MRGAISKKRGSQPRWPEKAEGMERSKRARRRKLDTAKADLKPPLAVLRRAGCPPRGRIRRACGEVPGRNRWGNSQDEPVGQRWSMVESALSRRRRSHSPTAQGVCGRHGTEEQHVTSGELAESPGGTGVSRPISESEVASEDGKAEACNQKSKDDEGGSVRLAKNPYIIVRGYWRPDSTFRM